ncbi:nTE family protein rssA [Candidatus Erwinia dacicola]|uniref:NTE family protein rssA n=1 Tax=Candidatus Erwinia dacicola TaxID=252393 RepID=A0A328TNP7_9GAMM|nr:nTE family protein rssA [Candidatus Erwinia dacicola]
MINVLERAGICIDVVVGCSVGALVGIAYATQRLPLMERWVRLFSYWQVIRLMDFSW